MTDVDPGAYYANLEAERDRYRAAAHRSGGVKSLGGTSRPPRPPARLWRWCSTRGRGYMLEPGAELCPGCHAPIPPTPSNT